MIKEYLRLLRVGQWIKNIFVFVPLTFSRHLFERDYFVTVFLGFIIFCLASSIVYIINDIVDTEADRAHPTKKNRPIASGKISKAKAFIIGALLLIIIAFSLTFFNLAFILCIISYLMLNLLYSIYAKHIVLLDVFSIATGFMLRVLGGAYIIDVYISSWLILTTMFISLFLAVMKRHSELDLFSESEPAATRKVLIYYSRTFTQQMATISAAAVIICYALYTVSQRTVSAFQTENLIYTTPFVVFGIFRYMFLVYMNQKGENTIDIMLTDIPLIVNIFLYIVSITAIVYHLF